MGFIGHFPQCIYCIVTMFCFTSMLFLHLHSHRCFSNGLPLHACLFYLVYRFCVSEKMCGVCFSESGLFPFTWWAPALFIFLHRTWLISLWLYYAALYRHTHTHTNYVHCPIIMILLEWTYMYSSLLFVDVEFFGHIFKHGIDFIASFFRLLRNFCSDFSIWWTNSHSYIS